MSNSQEIIISSENRSQRKPLEPLIILPQLSDLQTEQVYMSHTRLVKEKDCAGPAQNPNSASYLRKNVVRRGTEAENAGRLTD